MRESRLLFLGAGSFMCGILFRTLYAVPLSVLCALVFFVILSCVYGLFQKGKYSSVLVIMLLAFLCGLIRVSVAEVNLPKQFESYINTKVTFTGVVDGDPSIRIKNQHIVVRVREHAAVTHILVSTSLSHRYAYGERVEISGKLTRPESFSTEGGRMFDYPHYLSKSYIFSVMNFGVIHETSPPRGMWYHLADMLFGIKHLFVSGLKRSLPSLYAALATGLLTGDQHQMDDTVKNMLGASGLVWVVVLAGYHVTVLAEGMVKATRWLPRGLSYTVAISMVGMIVFATGASAPSLRGGFMTALQLYARATDRMYDSLRALCIAAIAILLWNPFLLAYDVGLQLSFIVTPAIIICTPLIESRLLWIRSAFLREIISISAIAQLAVFPLLLWQTGGIELWAIPANMLIMPIVPLAMGSSVLAGLGGIFRIPFIGFPARFVLSYFLSVAQIATALPGSRVTLPPFSFLWVLVMYGVLIYFAILLAKTTQPR